MKKLSFSLSLITIVVSIAFLVGSSGALAKTMGDGGVVAGNGNSGQPCNASVTVDGDISPLTIIAGAENKVTASGQVDESYEGLQGSISVSGDGVSAFDSSNDVGVDNQGSVNDSITITASTPGTTGSLNVDYEVDDSTGYTSGCSDSITIPVQVVAAATSMPLYVPPADPANSYSIQPCYPYTQCPSNTPFYLVPGGDGDVSPVIPTGDVICGVMSTGLDNKGYMLANEPIACPISQQALNAGFSWFDTGTHVDSSDNAGSLPCPDTSGIGLLDAVAKYGKSEQTDIADCGVVYSSGVAYASRTYVEPVTGGHAYLCPSDSIVTGAVNSPAKNDSWYEVQCTQILFPASAQTPPPAPPSVTPPTISASPNPVQVGQPITINWNTSGIPVTAMANNRTESLAQRTVPVAEAAEPSNCYLGGGVAGSVPASTTGSTTTVATSPGVENFSVTCINNGSNSFNLSSSTSVTVTAPPASTTVSLSASSYSITQGQSSALTWTTTNATSCAASASPADSAWSSASEPANDSGPGVAVAPSVTTAYTLSCANTNPNGAGASSTITITVTPVPPAPTGTVAVSSFNSVTHDSVSSTWTFSAPSGSSLNSCTSSTCSGTSGTYPNQPVSATSTYTITEVGVSAPSNTYSFDSSASNPSSQKLADAGDTITFNLAWDPVASMSVTSGNLALTSSTTSGQATITNNGTNGSTLSGLTASVPSDASSWLSVSGISSASLAAGSSVNATISVNTSVAPACTSGCSETINFSGTSAPGTASQAPAGSVSIIYYGPDSPYIPPCTGSGCNATAMISASPTGIVTGSSTTLTWSSTNATSCSASSQSQGAGDLSAISGTSGSQSVTPTTPGTKYYDINCPSQYASSGGATGTDEVAVTVVNNQPSLSMSVSPNSIPEGSSSTLSWSSMHTASTCTASNAWSGSQPNKGTQTVDPASPGTYVYELTCMSDQGDISTSTSATLVVTTSTVDSTSTVTVNMTPQTQSINVGQSANFSWSASSTPDIEPVSCTSGWDNKSQPASGSATVAPGSAGTYTYTVTCTNGAGVSGAGTATVNVSGDDAQVALSLSTTTIPASSSATLYWQSLYAQPTCTASGAWSGSEPSQGQATVSQAGTYTLTCDSSAGGNSGSDSATLNVGTSTTSTVGVALDPHSQEIAIGSSAQLSWFSASVPDMPLTCGGISSPAENDSWNNTLQASSSTGTNITPGSVGTHTYTLQCENTDGVMGADSATVNVVATSTCPVGDQCNPQPVTVTITPVTQTIYAPGTALVTWSSYNAESCAASGAWSGDKSTQGSQLFAYDASQTGTYDYSITCSDGNGNSSALEKAIVHVIAPQNPVWVALNLESGENTISRGSTIMFSWQTENAQSCSESVSPLVGGGSWSDNNAPTSSSGQQVTPTVAGNYTYKLSCIDGNGNTASSSVPVQVLKNPPACQFSASPSSISAGASSELSWNCSSTPSCTLDGSPVTSPVQESPTKTTTYNLQCTNQDGTFNTSTTISVGAPGIKEGNP